MQNGKIYAQADVIALSMQKAKILTLRDELFVDVKLCKMEEGAHFT